MIRTLKLVAVLALGLSAGTASLRAGEKLSKEEFVAKAIDCNVTEKDLAEKAVKSANSADVRKYAEKLVKDHERLNSDCVALARDLKLGVVTGVSAEHKQALLDLTGASGAAFDRKFVSYMVKSHEKAVKMFEANAKDNASAEVRKLAAAALPTLRAHLEEARKLDKSINK